MYIGVAAWAGVYLVPIHASGNERNLKENFDKYFERENPASMHLMMAGSFLHFSKAVTHSYWVEERRYNQKFKIVLKFKNPFTIPGGRERNVCVCASACVSSLCLPRGLFFRHWQGRGRE